MYDSRMNRALLILAMLFSGQVFSWTLNDVSLLLPLPEWSEVNELLSPFDLGEKGELLPLDVYKSLPSMVIGADPELIYNEHLKVIALRIDPCFLEKNSPYACRRQIRMVWQPVLPNGLKTITADAAFHSFYDLDDKEWSQLLKLLAPLSQLDLHHELDVHPLIRRQGLKGEHWQILKSIFLKFIGSENLVRATVMTVDQVGSFWVFSGVNVESGVISRIQIPRIDRVNQGFFLDLSDLREMRTSINPYPENAANWLNLVTDSKRALREMSRSEMSEALGQALKIENPQMEDPSSMDCVSCHIAQSVRLWADRNLSWDWKSELSESWYQSNDVNLKNNSVNPGFANRLRAFGYFIDEPVISQRLINESAEALTAIRLYKETKN